MSSDIRNDQEDPTPSFTEDSMVSSIVEIDDKVNELFLSIAKLAYDEGRVDQYQNEHTYTYHPHKVFTDTKIYKMLTAKNNPLTKEE
jgi:hypothetical protein